MQRFRTLAAYIFVFCLCAASFCHAAEFKDVTPTEAYQLIQDAAAKGTELIILDIRTEQEFLTGHIENARLINFYDSDFAERLSTLPRETPYLVYCLSGNRSGQAMPVLQQLGFSHVYLLSSGITGWNQANLPVVH